jgi:hypothetical protein
MQLRAVRPLRVLVTASFHPWMVFLLLRVPLCIPRQDDVTCVLERQALVDHLNALHSMDGTTLRPSDPPGHEKDLTVRPALSRSSLSLHPPHPHHLQC